MPRISKHNPMTSEGGHHPVRMVTLLVSQSPCSGALLSPRHHPRGEKRGLTTSEGEEKPTSCFGGVRSASTTPTLQGCLLRPKHVLQRPPPRSHRSHFSGYHSHCRHCTSSLGDPEQTLQNGNSLKNSRTASRQGRLACLLPPPPCPCIV